MVCPGLSDGDGLQIWVIAIKILNSLAKLTRSGHSAYD
jgi:hypothetical protein